MIKKILRIALWTIAAGLLLFISFMAGGVTIILDIENKCQQYSTFTTSEDTVFMCQEIHIVKPEIDKGVDS